MLELIKNIYRRHNQRILYESRQYETANKQLDDAIKVLNEGWEKGETYDSNWVKISSGKDSDLQFDEENQSTMQTQAYKFWKSHPLAKAVIRNLVKFVFGKGAKIHPITKNTEVKKAWDDFVRQNEFRLKQKEIGRRCFRDGECFIWYTIDNQGNTTIRFIDPQYIADPKGNNQDNISHGIETDIGDVEKVKFYHYSTDGQNSKKIPAKEIQHIKILVDSNVKRGLSILYVAMKYFLQYDKWLNYRILLNYVRTAVAIVRKIDGTPAQVSSIGAGQESPNASTSKSSKQKMLKAGTILSGNQGVTYEMLSPNMQAQDAARDGREIKLCIAAGTGLPEYMVSGDASNANYSSTMIAESPGVREFEDWQEFFEVKFEEIYRRVIQAKIYNGKIKDDPKFLECMVNFPEMIARKIKEETEAIAMQQNMGIVSDHTAAARLGYDLVAEKELIKKEEKTKKPEDIEKPAEKPEQPDENKFIKQEETETGILSEILKKLDEPAEKTNS